MSNEHSPMNDQEMRERQIDLFFGSGNWRYADDLDFGDVVIEYWNGFAWLDFVAANSCRRCSLKCLSKIRDLQRCEQNKPFFLEALAKLTIVK